MVAEHTCTDSAIGKSDYQPKDSSAGTGGIHMPSIQPMTHSTCIQVLIPPLGKVITNQKILLLALAGYTCHPSMPSI